MAADKLITSSSSSILSKSNVLNQLTESTTSYQSSLLIKKLSSESVKSDIESTIAYLSSSNKPDMISTDCYCYYEDIQKLSTPLLKHQQHSLDDLHG